jgi:soluble lytic murein transglycosylase
MKKKHLKLVIIFFILFLNNNFVYANKKIILPEKKPILNNEQKSKKIGNYLIPLKKPTPKVEKVEPKKVKKLIVDGEIIPRSKPLVVKTDKSVRAKKSKYYSKKDYQIAKTSIKSMEQKKWSSAEKTAKKARDKSIYDFIRWKHLLTTGNQLAFHEYKKFIELHPKYPRINRIKYLAEHKMATKNLSPNFIINWFKKYPPLSGFGKIVLGQTHLKKGDSVLGVKLIKEGWITADLSRNDMKFFRKKFKKILNSKDYIKRADYLAYENKYWDLKRMLRYLPKDYQLLYTARQLLMSRSYGVDNAINKVPQKLKNDSGLNYDRLKWRRKRGRLDGSLEILLKIKNTKEYMIRPDKWWVERGIIGRSLIYKKKYETAYKIVSNHALTEGPEYAEAEWMSGWIALSFLKDAILAESHFKNFYNNVGYPISLSRGSYWLGRTYEKIGKKVLANEWYNESSKYLTTYYGQLSHLKINPNKEIKLNQLMEVDKDYAEKFYKKDIVKIVHLLDELNKDKYTKHLLKGLANDNVLLGSEILAAKLATDISRFDFAVQIAKIASYEKRFHNKYNYPVISTPKVINGRKIPDSAFILSIIRQESEFDTSAYSRAGAKGLMQLMTYTARVVAKKAKLPYSKSRLTSDPEYNVNLGSHYIAGLILEYEGSYPFAIAAYNAGPKRVGYWKKINKNPQKDKIDYVDWIELIKFKETRNYVQRVLENYNVYRYILEQKPIKLKDFFKNDPLY